MIVTNFKAATQRNEKKKHKRRKEEKRKNKTLRKAQPTSQPIYPFLTYCVTYLFLSPSPSTSIPGLRRHLLFSASLPSPVQLFSIYTATARNHSSLPLPILTADAAPSRSPPVAYRLQIEGCRLLPFPDVRFCRSLRWLLRLEPMGMEQRQVLGLPSPPPVLPFSSAYPPLSFC